MTRPKRLDEDDDAIVKRYLKLVSNESLVDDIPPKRKQTTRSVCPRTKKPRYERRTEGRRQTGGRPLHRTKELQRNHVYATPRVVAALEDPRRSLTSLVSHAHRYESLIDKIVNHLESDIDVGLHHGFLERNLNFEHQYWRIPDTMFDSKALFPSSALENGIRQELDEIDSFWSKLNQS
ncbi:hypothetical protein DICA3_C18712 [Diutina catenulata]